MICGKSQGRLSAGRLIHIFRTLELLHRHFYMYIFQSKLRMAKKETFKSPWLLCVPLPFIFKISEFFPHSIFLRFPARRTVRHTSLTPSGQILIFRSQDSPCYFLWWTKRYPDRCFFNYLRFPLSIRFH